MASGRAWLGALLTFIVMTSGAMAANEPEEAIAMIQAWQPGDPVPSLALEYVPSDGCFCLPPATDCLFDYVESYELLMAIVGHRDAERRVLEAVLERALQLAGPTRVFQDVMKIHDATPSLSRRAWHRALRRRARRPHVVVDMAFERQETSNPDAQAVLDDMRGELIAGGSWSDVYGRYADRVGNGGRFVIEPRKANALPDRPVEIPEEHAAALLQAHAGEVITLEQIQRECRSEAGIAAAHLSGATNVTDRGFCESIGYRYVEVRERVLYFIAETYPGEPR